MLGFSEFLAATGRFCAACTTWTRANGGAAVAFVVAMLGINLLLIVAGGALSVLGDPLLIEAAGRAAAIVAPAIGAAAAVLAFVDRRVRV